MILENNSSMKKILFIATSNFYIDTGGGIANRAYYNALKEVYPNCVDVIHIQVSQGIETPSNFYQVPPLSNVKRLGLLVSGKLHRYYSYVLNFVDKRKGEYSHCFINTGVLGDLVKPLQERGIKVAVIHHNYEVDFQRDSKRPTTFWGLYTGLVSNNERKAYKESDLNLFLTESDKKTFNDNYGDSKAKHNTVIGTFEAEERESVITTNEPLNQRLLTICGSLNSVQTLQGIKDFSANYLPLLHKYYNDNFTLTLTGRSPVDFIRKLAEVDDNIQLIPSPVSISDVIRQCGIFICPTNVGGGIKLRIMDGLKLGMPIITHEVSARGYDSFFNMPWFKVYNDSISFTQALEAINNLIVNMPQLRMEIIKEYRNIFSFISGKKRFIESVKDFANS